MLSACASQMSAGPTTAHTRYAGGTAPEATAQIRSMAGSMAADPRREPSDTYRVTRITTTKTGVAMRIAIGWMTSIVPTPVPTPRPPWNRRKIEWELPMTAAPAHSTSASGSPLVRMRARRTGRAPFARSPMTTTAAHLRPSARSALVPPVRPDPIVRGSTPPLARATMTPNGIDPAR